MYIRIPLRPGNMGEWHESYRKFSGLHAANVDVSKLFLATNSREILKRCADDSSLLVLLMEEILHPPLFLVFLTSQAAHWRNISFIHGMFA